MMYHLLVLAVLATACAQNRTDDDGRIHFPEQDLEDFRLAFRKNMSSTGHATNDTSCLTKDQESGVCVNYNLCKWNRIIVEEEPIIHLRDGPCPSEDDICCIEEQLIDPHSPPPDQPKKMICADNSNAPDKRCNITLPMKPTLPAPKPQSNKCLLPPYPAHGSYKADLPSASPGQSFDTVQVNVTCDDGYGVIGDSSLYCINGSWSQPDIPRCVRFCRLKPHPSVAYHCSSSSGSVMNKTCSKLEPPGTVVKPECRAPNYYFFGDLIDMTCIDGDWSYIAICNPECGRITPEEQQRGGVPWHAGIYRKTSTPYFQICGGTVVSTHFVISAAHCFWSDLEGKQPASSFAVAVGKLYNKWDDENDVAQTSDVTDIRLPRHFLGSAANYQADIAVLRLATALTYNAHVRPVCLDFGSNFQNRHLQVGINAKVAGWRLTEGSNKTKKLKTADFPYVGIRDCIESSPPEFREYITYDKICAGTGNGTTLCRGDSGGGLVFMDYDGGAERFFLRGIVSTTPNNDDLCNTKTLTLFTQVSKHKDFIMESL